MRNTKRIISGAIAPLALAVSLAAAPASQPSTSDQRFMVHAAQGGLKEIAMGRLAAGQADTAAVRDFGRMMVTDHAAANDQMLTIAMGEGLDPPKALSPDAQMLYDKLSGLHGKAFDQAYVRAMVADHQDDITEYQQEIDHGTDPAVKDAARDSMPMLKRHLQLAQSLSATVGR